MSLFNKRRDDIARTQNARTNLFLFSRKAQIKKEIQTLLRDKTANINDSNLQLSLLRYVVVLFLILIVEKKINAKFKKLNKEFKNIEQNINKITTAIKSFATIAKTKNRLKKNTTTTKLAKFNNLNQQRQLNELKKSKILIYTIKEKNEKTKIKALFNKKLIKKNNKH
jgi:type III secretory pathway component EscR